MFYVKIKKGAYRRYEVYAVKEEYGDIKFLLYENGKWFWVDADKYEPTD